MLMVLQNKLVPEFAGTYQVKITATYQGPKNLVKLTAYFLLTVKASQSQNPVIIPPEVKKEVIIAEKWPGLVYEGRFKQPALPKKDEPIPYIRDFSPTGVMLIGWTDQMKPIIDFSKIPPALVAVKVSGNFQENKVRRLAAKNEALFKSQDGTFFGKMEIIKALEIKIVKKGDDEEDEIQNIEFTYDLLDY